MNTGALKSAISLIGILLGLASHAQKNRFIYVQTENMHPFYVKMDKKVLSSSASGYIIISKLIDSTYNFSVGFPKNEWPEYNVTISVKETDAGLLLKNLGERGWGLFNMQTMQVVMHKKNMELMKASEAETNGDAFSTILASVVNDPTIMQKAIVKNEVQPEEKYAENKIEETPLVKEEEVKPVLENKKKVNIAPGKTKITKLKYAVTRQGVNIAYLDIVNGVADTVNVFIPALKPVTIKNAEKPDTKLKLIQLKDNSKNKGPKPLDMKLLNTSLKRDADMAIVIKGKKLL